MKLMKTLTAAIALGAFSLMATPEVTFAKGKPEQSQKRDKPCPPKSTPAKREQKAEIKGSANGFAWDVGTAKAEGKDKGVLVEENVTKELLSEGSIERKKDGTLVVTARNAAKLTAEGLAAGYAEGDDHAAVDVAIAGGVTTHIKQEVTIQD